MHACGVEQPVSLQPTCGGVASVGESRGRVLRPLAVVKGDRRLRRCEGGICTASHVRLHAKVLQIASESRYEEVSRPVSIANC